MSVPITALREMGPADEAIAERIFERFQSLRAEGGRIESSVQSITDMLANDADGVTPQELAVAEAMMEQVLELLAEAARDTRVARDTRDRLRAEGSTDQELLADAARVVAETFGEEQALGELHVVLSRVLQQLDVHPARRPVRQ